MNIYIPLGLFLLLICYFHRNNPYKSVKAFIFSMSVMAIFGAIRYNMGADYLSYMQDFENVHGYGFDNFYYYIPSRTEPGFIFLLSIIPSFFAFVIVLTIAWHALISYVCVKFIPSQFLWLTFFLLLFDEHFIIQNYVALRSSIVCCLFMLAFLCLLKRKKLWFVGLILLSTSLHTSAIALLLFVYYEYSYRYIKNFNWQFFLPLFLVLLVFRQYITGILASSVIENFSSMSRYEGYIEDYNERAFSAGSILYMIVSLVPPILMIPTMKKEADEKYLFIIFCSVVVLFMNVFVGSLMVRYFMYVGPLILIAYFRSSMYMIKGKQKLLFLSLILCVMYNFVVLQFAPWFTTFLQYKTIFDAPSWI